MFNFGFFEVIRRVFSPAPNHEPMQNHPPPNHVPASPINQPIHRGRNHLQVDAVMDNDVEEDDRNEPVSPINDQIYRGRNHHQLAAVNDNRGRNRHQDASNDIDQLNDLPNIRMLLHQSQFQHLNIFQKMPIVSPDAYDGLVANLTVLEWTESNNPEKECSEFQYNSPMPVRSYLTLDDETWINDDVLHFAISWIMRDASYLLQVKTFDSYFMDTLLRDERDGVRSVEKWTRNKRGNLNVFEKRRIFIPINADGTHWILYVVVNPGKIEQQDDADDAENTYHCCILKFDSLETGRGGIHGNAENDTYYQLIIKWLNCEWNAARPTEPHRQLFNQDSCHLYQPRIQCQTDSHNCGVYMLFYFVAMLKLRHVDFTLQQTEADTDHSFEYLISNSEEFNYDNIVGIREELRLFLERLYVLAKNQE